MRPGRPVAGAARGPMRSRGMVRRAELPSALFGCARAGPEKDFPPNTFYFYYYFFFIIKYSFFRLAQDPSERESKRPKGTKLHQASTTPRVNRSKKPNGSVSASIAKTRPQDPRQLMSAHHLRPIVRLIRRPLSTKTKPTAAPKTPPVLEKPAKFNPPSHGSRRPAPRAYPGPPLSAKEKATQRTKKYPNMMPAEGTFMRWFLTNRGLHVYITLVCRPPYRQCWANAIAA
jgi:hypothetical protein